MVQPFLQKIKKMLKFAPFIEATPPDSLSFGHLFTSNKSFFFLSQKLSQMNQQENNIADDKELSPFSETSSSHLSGVITEMSEGLDPKVLVNDRNSLCIVWDNTVPFPYLGYPMTVTEHDFQIARRAEHNREAIVVANWKEEETENGATDRTLNDYGVLAQVIKTFEMPDGEKTAIFGFGPEVKIENVVRSNPELCVSFTPAYDKTWDFPERTEENRMLLMTLHNRFGHMVAKFGGGPQVQLGLQGFNSLLKEGNFICAVMPISTHDRLSLLNETNLRARFTRALGLLEKSTAAMTYRQELQEKTRVVLDERQREHFLREEMETIRTELGQLTGDVDFIDPEKGIENFSDNPDIQSLITRAKEKEWSKETQQVFYKQLSNLDRLPMSSPDYSIQYTYLDNFLNLPWNHISKSDFTLEGVENKLNEDHYGLDKVKERILDHMAVVKLRGDMKSPILCLYGPPGVGKTSLGRSIADALGRDYARVSLGGLHDEAEIRGHRRTYLGALPGRIISALMKCKTSNPVIVLDEIDKIGRDHKGDPSSALLEVLDPEQNSKFHDNYLDCDYDLSNVLFIATANTLDTVSRPLRDRMELVEISGYIPDEKVEIARRHLIPKELEAHGFDRDEITFSEEAIRFIINSYTRESGVRLLDKKIAEAMRKLARLKVSGKEMPKEVTPELLKSFYGKEDVMSVVYENNDFAGVVTGLAWTAVGGEILFIESALTKGKGDKLTLTGNLGDVMKESAAIALQYVRSHAEKLGIPQAKFSEYDVHVHVPEGAVPKDGPSAGITMATSLASAFTGRKVRANLAMTGEITLRGKVLPVGGIKEKILAAKRAGITDIILSVKNQKDIEEIPEKYLEGLTFHYVERVEEVLDYALLEEQAKY